MREYTTERKNRMAYPYQKDLKKNLAKPPLHLVKVTWLDAATYNEGWHDIDALPVELDYFETYGIHFMTDKECVYLTDTVRSDRFVGTIQQIPKGMVRKIEKIKEIEQDFEKPKEEEAKSSSLKTA